MEDLYRDAQKLGLATGALHRSRFPSLLQFEKVRSVYHRPWITVALLCATLLLIVDVSNAQLLRRRRNSNTRNYYNYSYSANNYLQSAPAKNDDPSAEYRYLDAVYVYDQGKKPEHAFTDRIRVFLRIDDEDVMKADEPMVAEVEITDLRDENSTAVCYVSLSLERQQAENHVTAVFDVTHQNGKQVVINPARVYRLHVNLHRKSDKYGKKSVLGRMSYPYYVATSGEGRLERARQQIAMRTFREWYYAKQGWQTDEYYVMDCYAYYMWATGFCTRGATDGHTNLWQLFDDKTPFDSGSDIPALAEKNPIHGDYVRMPGHSFMLLAYDAEQNQVWTMEGNYGATIEIVTRHLDHGWTIGHLLDRHIRRGMFKVTSQPKKKAAT